MYKHVLVPTDGSPLSEKAVKSAAQLAALCGAKVTALSVIPPYAETVYAEGLSTGTLGSRKKYKEVTEKAARAALDRVTAGIAAEGVKAGGTFVIGERPWESIIRVARAEKCDVIVMASHGRSGLSGMILGSETQKVLTHSKIPVLVVR
jgi:nucleotide-binding universal stress UspA family protein